MSEMMIWSFNLLIISILIFIAGMLKPKVLLFWMSNPSRIHIQLLVGALLMGAAVLYGEANLRKQQEMEASKALANTVIEETPTIIKEAK